MRVPCGGANLPKYWSEEMELEFAKRARVGSLLLEVSRAFSFRFSSEEMRDERQPINRCSKERERALRRQEKQGGVSSRATIKHRQWGGRREMAILANPSIDRSNANF